MPIYEYECNACGARHEFIQKFSEGPKRKCPSCGNLRLKKLVSAAAFHLKGSGWYVTDFRDKDGSKNKGDDGGSGEAKADSGSESKADTKDASKSDKPDKPDKSEKKKDGKTKSSDSKGKTKAA